MASIFMLSTNLKMKDTRIINATRPSSLAGDDDALSPLASFCVSCSAAKAPVAPVTANQLADQPRDTIVGRVVDS